jgi:hypothetical protein
MRRRRLASVSAFAAACTTLVVVPAAAAPSARLVYLRNVGAEACPNEAVLRAAVAARLGYDPFFASAAQTMFAEISKVSAGFHARIKLVDEANLVRGTRELAHDGNDCAAMIDTMALSMSIAIDPDSLTRPAPAPLAAVAPVTEVGSQPLPVVDPSPPASAAGHTPTATIPNTRRPTIATLAATRPKVHLDAGVGVAGWAGAAPSITIGGTLSVRAQYTDYSIALEARGDLGAEQALSVGRVRTSLWFAALAPCAHVSWFVACGVAAVGRLSASSLDVTAPQSDVALHVALGPRIGAEYWLGRAVAVRADLNALYTLTPQALQINGQTVYTLPRISVGVGAGVVWRWR